MNTFSHLARYKNVQVTTSSGPDLLLMLYDGFFRFCREAHQAFEHGDRATFGIKVMRAHAIVEHLATVLDHGASPDVAGSLAPIYMFILEKLSTANLRQDTNALAAAERVMKPIRDAFDEVIRGREGSTPPSAR